MRLIIRTRFLMFCFSVLVILPLGFTHAQTDITVENVGNLGGWPECAVAQGNNAFLVQAKALTVFDATGGQLQRVTYLALDEEPDNMVLHDNYIYAFATWSDIGVQIIDISNPLEPTMAGTMNLETGWVARGFVADNHAYVAMTNSLKVIDVSDKAAPVEVKTVNTSAEHVFINGQYAYVGHDQGMTIFDVSNPADPVEKGTHNSDEVTDIFVTDSHAFLCHEIYPNIGVSVVDVADADNPFQSGFVQTKTVQGAQTAYKNPQKVVVEGDYAYVVCEGSAYLFVADVTDPSNPFLTGNVQFVGAESAPSIGSLSVVFPYAIVVTRGTGPGVYVLDVSDEENPGIASTLDEPWTLTHLFACGDTLYLASERKLWIYRFPDPLNPTPVLLGSDTTWAEMRRLFVQDDRLYGIKQDDMYIVDVADPADMEELGVYQSPNGDIREIYVLGDYAYLLVRPVGIGVLEIVNISDPANPFKENEYALPGEGRDLFVAEGSTIAYVAYYDSGSKQGFFRILDVSIPSSVVLLSTTPTVGRPSCIWVEQNLMCIGSNDEEAMTWHLEAFNVQDKANPVKHDEETGSGSIWDVKIHENMIVASIPENCLWFFAGLAYLYEFDATFAEFDNFMFELAEICPSPGSLLIEFLYYAGAFEYMLWLSIDGHGCPDFLEFYASLGLFIQRFFFGVDVDVVGEDADFNLPTKYALSQNYPNPFNPSTAIRFTVKEKCHVKLKVYDVFGREVATLVDEVYTPGQYQTLFDPQELAAGVYVYRIQAGDFQAERKMVLVR